MTTPSISEGREGVARGRAVARVSSADRVVEDDRAVEVDVRVLALGALGHLELHVEELPEVVAEFRDLREVETADVQVVLQPLQVLARREHVVAEEDAAL